MAALAPAEAGINFDAIPERSANTSADERAITFEQVLETNDPILPLAEQSAVPTTADPGVESASTDPAAKAEASTAGSDPETSSSSSGLFSSTGAETTPPASVDEGNTVIPPVDTDI
jgi:hypothetical protein